MLNKILIVAMIIVAWGCSDNSITTPNNELVVVSGFLRAGEKTATIKLSNTLTLGYADTIPVAINDAEVFLIKDGMSYRLNPSSTMNGDYSYRGNDFSIESGDLFSLLINYRERKITGSTLVPDKPHHLTISRTTFILTNSGYGMGSVQDTSSIFLKWNNPDSSLYYVVLENLEINPTAINTSNTQKGINRTMIFPPMVTNQFLIGRRNLMYLGNHRAIVYKVNQEYADLYESRTQDSRNLNEPISNIINGLGVFSAFASDTTLFYVKAE